MALPVFPNLAGITWPITRSPSFSNIIQTGITGKRTALRQQIEPRWNYELAVTIARSTAGFTEFHDLLTVFQSCYGSYGLFLFDDLYDDSVTDQEIGIGDGIATDFFLLRTYGSFVQRVAALNGSPTIKRNGSVVADYTISASGIVSFSTPPAPGVLVTWSGMFYWICRFADDQLDLSQFMPNFWEARSVKFTTELVTG